MMKRLDSLILVATLGTLFWAGCGVEKGQVPLPVDVDSLLTRAWTS